MDNDARQSFLSLCDDWICDGYSLDVRFMAGVDEHGLRIWDASVLLFPLVPKVYQQLAIDNERYVVGQIQKTAESKSALIAFIDRATRGVIEIDGKKLVLPKEAGFRFESSTAHRDRWFWELHLSVVGSANLPLSDLELVAIDNSLRRATPPFDGLADVSNWLNLRAPIGAESRAALSVHVSPPVDLMLDSSSIADGKLTLTMHAHPALDVKRIGLAIRESFAGSTLEARTQVANRVKWGDVSNDRREGVAVIDLTKGESAIAMLMIGGSTVRRQWFVDPARASNRRLAAVQHFDKSLKMVQKATLELNDASKFESGIASLLFMLGFNPCLLVETDAPDLIVATPMGKLVLVECTMRVSDVHSKLGKLVDRRGSLRKAIEQNGERSDVFAVLICRLPRDQIALEDRELLANDALLVSREDLNAGFDLVRGSNDPDKILEKLSQRLAIESD